MPSNVSLRTRFQSLIVGRMSVDVLSNAQRRNVRTAGGSGLHAAFASSLLARTALVSLTGRNFPRSVLSTLRGRVDTSGVTVDRTRDCNEWVGYYQDLDVAQTSRYTENIPETSLNIPEALRESACVFLAAMHPALQLEVLSQLDNPAVVMVDTIRGFVKHEPDFAKPRTPTWQ